LSDVDLIWGRKILETVAGEFLYIPSLFFSRYTALVEKNVAQAAKDMEKVLEVSMSQIMEDYPPPPSEPPYPLFSKQFFRRHGRDLFACSCTWFLVDIVFYSINLFQPQIYGNLPNTKKKMPTKKL
jgi:PHS family inorganic phosphate transporter-like MFS transporter